MWAALYPVLVLAGVVAGFMALVAHDMIALDSTNWRVLGVWVGVAGAWCLGFFPAAYVTHTYSGGFTGMVFSETAYLLVCCMTPAVLEWRAKRRVLAREQGNG